DVEDEETTGEVNKTPDLSTLYMLQIVSKAIDISLAKELKNLLFGSSLCCFSEEWKIQSFTFNNTPQLKYGIVQKKGGPCGVLAAVQACVLQQLIFADSNRNKDTRCLQPSEAHRTKCLSLALADILWRAGGHEKALVALPSGRQQFTPTGKYKADGILETKLQKAEHFPVMPCFHLRLSDGFASSAAFSQALVVAGNVSGLMKGGMDVSKNLKMEKQAKNIELILHSATRYEDLILFLQQNIHQFEIGPYGCILLTVSVILSRSINL
ncbi:hypothetical protein DV515_00001284, partial [Chloebia gouldiae]